MKQQVWFRPKRLGVFPHGVSNIGAKTQATYADEMSINQKTAEMV
jgi:hypothetical protein